MTALKARCFLFLQGPPGPFFAEVAAALEAHGHRCLRINLNGGDWLNWRRGAANFTGSIHEWPRYLAETLSRERVTDLILFGDCRPAHAVARDIAAQQIVAGQQIAAGQQIVAGQRMVSVHVFEEGYIRPDWVTLERGGVNGNSSLPRDPQAYLRQAAGLEPVPKRPPIPASFRQRAGDAVAYFAAGEMLAFHFKGYRSHRVDRSAAEAFGWAYRLLLRPVARLRSAITHHRLGDRRFFVLPLQLDSDHQIRSHSPFAGMTEAVERIVASFARAAPTSAVLVIKEHPLDNGLKSWRRIVASIASRHRVARRVLFLEHGYIDGLVVRAAGVVTVNSTTGTLALTAGRPVAVLGTAVYDLPGVTHQGGLDTFWSTPDKPRPALYDAFQRVLVERCLLRGGFSSKAARAVLVPAAATRLATEPGTATAAEPPPQAACVRDTAQQDRERITA